MSLLAGRRILIVEDEALVAALLEEMLLALGGAIVGPAHTLANAVELAQYAAIEGAVLDVNIQGGRVDPVADILRARSVPVVFATGYGAAAARNAAHEPVIEKPYTAETIAGALARALRLRDGRRASAALDASTASQAEGA